jgi:hypothetical protein
VYGSLRIIANAETSAPLLDATTALLSWQYSRTWGHDGMMGWMNGRNFWAQPYDGFLSLRLGGVSADLCGFWRVREPQELGRDTTWDLGTLPCTASLF